MSTASENRFRGSAEHRMVLLVLRARQMAKNGVARQLRRSARLTQAEVAAVCGVKPETVNRWEAGTRTPSGEPGRRYAVLLADLESQVNP